MEIVFGGQLTSDEGESDCVEFIFPVTEPYMRKLTQTRFECMRTTDEWQLKVRLCETLLAASYLPEQTSSIPLKVLADNYMHAVLLSTDQRCKTKKFDYP